ncbi:expressed unknown protein [Seminavis robusta]|uniref:Uncharacterized protein n=1 Tax=Seminavis robusta TaxID=568900 RepID=A0A9N8HBW2_9STRA|nr:expressed unknown protein [Seminavis robusta]|eukprot:Sro381_g130830.1 n/a (368) ;mRNA; r:35605-36941
MSLIGAVLVLPYMVVFFTFWLATSLQRPMMYATIFCLAINPMAAQRKLTLFVNTARYLLFSKDKKWKEPEVPKYTTVHKVETKTIIFVRHGQSTWNETFNRGEKTKLNFYMFFIPNAIKAFFMEWYFMVTGQDKESWFYDSPLNDMGKSQAESVRKFMRTNLQFSTPKEARLIRIMLGESPDGKGPPTREPSSQLVSSNLRRAISTLVIGARERLDRGYENDKVIILSQMQEVSFNPDALCITPAKGKCELAFTDPKFLKPYFDNNLDTSLHTGNKPITSNGIIRLQSFAETIFKDIKKENIVAAGHSLWFRSFFRTFLPKDYDHVSKVKKIRNGGCVGLEFQKKTTDNGVVYEIVPGSIVVLHIGF